jgi:hypothetical protein
MEVVQELLQNGSPAGMTQFLQGFVLYLSNSFPGNLENISHFLQGTVIAVVDAKAQPDNPFFSGG